MPKIELTRIGLPRKADIQPCTPSCIAAWATTNLHKQPAFPALSQTFSQPFPLQIAVSATIIGRTPTHRPLFQPITISPTCSMDGNSIDWNEPFDFDAWINTPPQDDVFQGGDFAWVFFYWLTVGREADIPWDIPWMQLNSQWTGPSSMKYLRQTSSKPFVVKILAGSSLKPRNILILPMSLPWPRTWSPIDSQISTRSIWTHGHIICNFARLLFSTGD